MILGALLLVTNLNAQQYTFFDLDESLEEISGLEQVNDSLFAAFNDGGDEPVLYLISEEGKISKKVEIANASNKDWETIARDAEYLYIGDVGNNNNTRKDLKIYRVSIDEVLSQSIVNADVINIKYKEQTLFPPSEDSLFFDAEGMTLYNDSLWIFMKNRAVSGERLSYVYAVPRTPGTYSMAHSYTLNTGGCGWFSCGVTAVDEKDGLFYILTYDKLLVRKFVEGIFEEIETLKFEKMRQRESVLVLENGDLLIADEKNPLLGEQKLYRLKLPGFGN